MKELRFLCIYEDFSDNITGETKDDDADQYLPNALQYLHWRNYPLWTLPNTFQGDNLVVLRMKHSSITQLWERGERKVLHKLKFLDLSHSKLTTLDLGLIPNLEVLSLVRCHGLVHLHMLGTSSHAIHPLLYYYTNNLVELRLPADKCLKLVSIELSDSKLKTIDLRSAVNLELLFIVRQSLVELHMPGKCVNLRSLRIGTSKLSTLDIGSTPNLEDLDLNDCCDLEDLHMADKCQKLISLNIHYSKLKNLDLGPTPNLKELNLYNCHNLVQVHVPIGCLENLNRLFLSGCLRFEEFSFEKMDASREVGPFAELHLIAKSLESCPLHPENTSPKFQFECFYKDDPSLTRNLEKIFSIGLCACTNLDTFSKSICGLRHLRKLKIEGYLEAPKELHQLKCLEELSLSNSRMKHLPDSICTLKHLKVLELQSSRLEKLPKNFSRLECLESLTLSSPNITHLPDSICTLKHLMYLKLKNCFLIEKLPEDLGRLECLEELYMSYTRTKHLPDTICMLKHLKVLVLYCCSLLEQLPDDLGRVGGLVKLDVTSSKIKHLPDTICMLKDLEELHLYDCYLLEKLPEDLGLVERLVELVLSYCNIKHLPDSICMLKDLKELHLDYCSLLEKLPEDLDRLEFLKNLNVVGTRISHIQQNICLLKGLRIEGSRELLQSCGFICDINTIVAEYHCYVLV